MGVTFPSSFSWIVTIYTKQTIQGAGRGEVLNRSISEHLEIPELLQYQLQAIELS
jgi:hypothetical protein